MSGSRAKAARSSARSRKPSPPRRPPKPAPEPPARSVRPYKIVGTLVAQVVNEDGKPVREVPVGEVEVFESMFDDLRKTLEAEWWPLVEQAFLEGSGPFGVS